MENENTILKDYITSLPQEMQDFLLEALTVLKPSTTLISLSTDRGLKDEVIQELDNVLILILLGIHPFSTFRRVADSLQVPQDLTETIEMRILLPFLESLEEITDPASTTASASQLLASKLGTPTSSAREAITIDHTQKVVERPHYQGSDPYREPFNNNTSTNS